MPKLIPVWLLIILCPSDAQQRNPGGRPPLRKHTITERAELKTIPAVDELLFKQVKKFKAIKNERKVDANGIPEHKVGRFPSRHNPNEVREQSYEFSLPLNPKPAREPIPLHNDTGRGPPNIPFGIALNGVLFDPGTAEFYMGDRHADWNYEALSGSVLLGLDANHGHVQPNGSYHYHGLPTGFLKKLGVKSKKHSPLIGYAMDGFPIYALYGYKNPKNPKGGVKKMASSFQLKKGKRPDPPGGRFDGTFSKDYEYVEGSGDLDKCNGRFTVTKEYPDGTYAYFLTEGWPVIPRYFKAEPLRLRGGTGYHRDGRPPPPRSIP
ncbi:MAG: YHYH protein [Verrucomicrobiota bacterium]|nr:YHYH protein [Verrucomicrobiota bacterium]MEC8790460.1 YHYH protein [Verrucomicrobiota bacterium]